MTIESNEISSVINTGEMPYTMEQENYFKLITLIYCFGTNVNRDLLHRFLHSTNTTLEQFINDHQHEIYHFFCDDKCCQCKTKSISPKRKFVKVINEKQMLAIFENSHSDRLDNHQYQSKEGLCCLKANKSVELKDLDFTLIRFFLVQFCYQVFWDCHLKHDNKSFSAFLVENVHKVYHLSVDKICCCKCNADRDIPDKCIHQKQFEIICKQGSSPCHHQFCSCQYTIQSNLTLSSLIQRDTDLTTKLTKQFCSSRKYLENIYENRNKIAHHPDCSINNDKFWEIWNKTQPNILEIAKALDKENEYTIDLQELIDGPTNKVLFVTVVLNLLKTSEHVTVNTLKKIEGKEDSIEDKIEAVYTLVQDIQIAKCNSMNNSDCSGLSIVNSLRDMAIGLCEENSPESDLDNFREVSFELKMQVNPTPIQTSQGSGDENSDQDEPTDNFTCGKCKENFTNLKKFCKHKDTCNTKQVKPAQHYLKIIGKFIISEASERLETNAAKMFQDNPDQFDTNEIDVRYVERGCLIVWTESSQYDLENEDKLKEDCIQFTKNMFQKCSLDSTETTNIKVNVKFSKTCQDSLQTKDDRSDYLHCGTCRQEFSTINTFISHKKECIRNRKINKQKQKDILKTDISKKTEDVALKTSGPIAENENIPSEIRLMSDKTSVPLYLKLLESGCEKKRDIRLVVVGMKGSGKTSFIKRLLNEDCTHVSRTNGIEVHRIRYNANSDDDVWKRLDDNKETSELHARLLKPYQETLISQNKGINKPSEESSAHKSIIKSLKRNESKQSEADSLAVVTESQVETPVTKEHQVTFSVATTSHDQTKILQLEQASREIETMLKSEVDLDDKEEYATLLLWDFAGDEEYYHTHQTFLSPDAIYLVFTKLNNVDDKEALDLFRLWMDSIHCYSTMNEKTNAYKDNTRIQEDLDPPVFIVGTWKDAVTSETEEINDACRANLLKYTEHMSEDVFGHIRGEVFISNTEDGNSVFQQIRQNILQLARQMKSWNKEYPLKFIQLEKLLQEKKKRLPIITFQELQHISTETTQPLTQEELILYLKSHHEIRALVFFEDLPDYIILDTQWLADAFKCIVTAKKFLAISIKNHKYVEKLYNEGKLHYAILEDIFKREKDILYIHKEHILNVMEKFDIIIPINSVANAASDTSCYYVPCMVKAEPGCDIYQMFNVTKDNCQKSSWLCFKFKFLPPHLMNHVIASLCRKYEFAEVDVQEERKKNSKRVISLFRGTAVFELKKTSKLTKLLITTCPNLILVQVLEFGKSAFLERGVYKDIADFVANEINKIISIRFKMTNVKFEKKWECGLTKPESVIGSNDFSTQEIIHYCETCCTTHKFRDEWSDLQSQALCRLQGFGGSSETNSKTETTSKNLNVSTKVRVNIKCEMGEFLNVSEAPTRYGYLTGFNNERINFAKMGIIVLNNLTDVLYDLLKQDKPNIRPRKDCDVTYLYREHRIYNMHIPSNGWGGTWQRIMSTDIAVGDDIERIRLTRNELQHSRIFMLNDTRFAELCNIINDLLERFDHHNKPTRLYTDQLNQILAKTISLEEVKAVEDELIDANECRRDKYDPWEPFWTSLCEASSSCQELVHNGCKKGCHVLCKCGKSGLPCTVLCACGGDCE